MHFMHVVPVAGQNRRCNESGSNLSIGFCVSDSGDEKAYTWAIDAYQTHVLGCASTQFLPKCFLRDGATAIGNAITNFFWRQGSVDYLQVARRKNVRTAI